VTPNMTNVRLTTSGSKDSLFAIAEVTGHDSHDTNQVMTFLTFLCALVSNPGWRAGRIVRGDLGVTPCRLADDSASLPIAC
jgi:hypothetical protein